MADLNQMAYRIMKHATEPDEEPSKAQINGRNGGRKGGHARAAKLTPEQRSAIAKKAADARWRKETGSH
ncbi:MAG TPA: histone H1 [Thermoanaerobaculia bacterium]|nr:histone H1 [Thermoanaerobaculia bacterium]